jgi:hypothetical protein
LPIANAPAAHAVFTATNISAAVATNNVAATSARTADVQDAVIPQYPFLTLRQRMG